MRFLGLAIAAAICFPRVRAKYLGWGASDTEQRMKLPGDKLGVPADLTATRAITIHASPTDVWAWVVQLGQNRGGFYSYDGLENAFGCEIHSASRVIPEWQHPSVGDHVDLYPGAGLIITQVEADRILVLTGNVGPQMPFDFSWSFILQPQLDGATRLFVRERYYYSAKWAPLLVEPTMVISFIMSRRMLHGIRSRATEISRVKPVPPLMERHSYARIGSVVDDSGAAAQRGSRHPSPIDREFAAVEPGDHS